MSLTREDVVIKDLFTGIEDEGEMDVCRQCGYIDCVCTKEYVN